ncbi:MAG: tripartite tricarboxylate transporter substrate binding protein [Proteobacteria bacterium]|nr:tripartite tricarboxylate transporter substrate binding protein [Burkholderiales bacterium]
MTDAANVVRWMPASLMPIALLLLATPVAPQTYPNKPVRVVVAQAAGSATDILARLLSQPLSEALGQQVVIDNRAGAGGLLGTEIAAKALPDGYTLLMASISTHGVNPALHTKLSYDPVRDFAPISLVATTANVIIVHPALPARNVQELIALAKSRPGQLNFATPGNGSSQHLATELLRSMAGNANMVHVPYKGSGGAIASVIAGETAWMMPALPSALVQIKSGRVRAIAVSSLQRSSDLPDVPTIAQSLPGYEVVTWYGLMAPAGTPASVISRLHADTTRLLATPELQRTFAASGLIAQSSTPEGFSDFVRVELARWAKVARQAGVKAE